MEVGEPRGALVVEVGERAPLEFALCVHVDGEQARRSEATSGSALTSSDGLSQCLRASSSARAASPIASWCARCLPVSASLGMSRGHGKGNVSNVVVGV